MNKNILIAVVFGIAAFGFFRIELLIPAVLSVIVLVITILQLLYNYY